MTYRVVAPVEGLSCDSCTIEKSPTGGGRADAMIVYHDTCVVALCRHHLGALHNTLERAVLDARYGLTDAARSLAQAEHVKWATVVVCSNTAIALKTPAEGGVWEWECSGCGGGGYLTDGDVVIRALILKHLEITR